MPGEFHDSPDIEIRRASADDARAIALVHIASWRGAYAGLIPDDFLASLDAEESERNWRRRLSSSESTTWVVLGNQRLIGFTSVGPARDEDSEEGDLELYSMYLDPESWGHGVARALMGAVNESAPHATRMTLWVLADNDRARRFYQRSGFHHDGVERIDEYGGKPLTAVRYVRSAK